MEETRLAFVGKNRIATATVDLSFTADPNAPRSPITRRSCSMASQAGRPVPQTWLQLRGPDGQGTERILTPSPRSKRYRDRQSFTRTCRWSRRSTSSQIGQGPVCRPGHIAPSRCCKSQLAHHLSELGSNNRTDCSSQDVKNLEAAAGSECRPGLGTRRLLTWLPCPDRRLHAARAAQGPARGALEAGIVYVQSDRLDGVYANVDGEICDGLFLA